MKKKHNSLAMKPYITIILLQIFLLPVIISCGNSEVVDSDIYGPWELAYVDTNHTVCSDKDDRFVPRDGGLDLQKRLQEMLIGFNVRNPNNKADSILFGGSIIDTLESRVIWDFSNTNVINIDIYDHFDIRITTVYVKDRILVVDLNKENPQTHLSKTVKYKLINGDIYWEDGIGFEGPFKIHRKKEKLELINRHDDVSCQDGGEVERRYVFLRK
jgi:hypothetical protein